MRKMYRAQIAVCKMEIPLIITFFAKQLTRTLEVLVYSCNVLLLDCSTKTMMAI